MVKVKVKVNTVMMLKARCGGAVPAEPVTVLLIKEFIPGRFGAYVAPFNSDRTIHVMLSDLEDLAQ